MSLVHSENSQPAGSVARAHRASAGAARSIVQALAARRPQNCPAWSPFAYTVSLDELIGAARALNISVTEQFARSLDTAVLICCDEALGVAKFGLRRGIEAYIRETFSALARGGEAAASVLERDGPGIVGDVTVVVRNYLDEALGSPSGDAPAWLRWVERVQKLAKSIVKKERTANRGNVRTTRSASPA